MPVTLALGVDGGGTSTSCAALDASTGRLLGRAVVPASSNPNSVGFDAACTAVWRALDDALRWALAKVGSAASPEEVWVRGVTRSPPRARSEAGRPSDPAGCPSEVLQDEAAAAEVEVEVEVGAVVLVCAGVDRDADKARWVTALRKRMGEGVVVAVDNDAVGALAAGTAGRLRGAVVIAGTGTIAVGFVEMTEDGNGGGLVGTTSDRSGRVRVSGWGPAFDDRGSGHHIGSRGLALAARAADGRGSHVNTRLLPDVLAHLGMTSAEELIPWAYAAGPAPRWADVASLAPVVTAAAAGGDAAATEAVDDAVEGLVESVDAVFAGMRRRERERWEGGRIPGIGAANTHTASMFDEDAEAVPLVLGGGLLTEGGLVATRLAAALRGRRNPEGFDASRAVLVHPAVGPEVGAALIACRHVSGSGWKPR